MQFQDAPRDLNRQCNLAQTQNYHFNIFKKYIDIWLPKI